jgi:hypothetical protein
MALSNEVKVLIDKLFKANADVTAAESNYDECQVMLSNAKKVRTELGQELCRTLRILGSDKPQFLKIDGNYYVVQSWFHPDTSVIKKVEVVE